MVDLTTSIVVYFADQLSPIVAVPLVDFTVADKGDGNGPQIVQWNAAKLGTQPSAATLAAVTQTQVNAYYTATLRAAAVVLTGDPGPSNKFTRAVLFAIGDEFNALITWINAFAAATAAATSLADLKSRVAALSVPATVTVANATAAVTAKINNGAAD